MLLLRTHVTQMLRLSKGSGLTDLPALVQVLVLCQWPFWTPVPSLQVCVHASFSCVWMSF